MRVFPDNNTALTLVSSFYYGFTAMKEAVVGGVVVCSLEDKNTVANSCLQKVALATRQRRVL